MRKFSKKLLSLLLVVAMIVPMCGMMFTVGAEDTSSIKVGDTITLGKYNGKDIAWVCVLIDSNGPLMMTKDVLCNKAYDASGVSEEYHTDGWGYIRKNYGSNCWCDSSLRQWLNSNDNKVSYSHCPPNYANEAGFMTNFTSDELKMIKKVKQKSYINSWETQRSGYCDGGTKESTDSITISGLNMNYSSFYYQWLTDSFFVLNQVQLYGAYKNDPNCLVTNTECWTRIAANTGASYENVYTFGSDSNSLQHAKANVSKGVRPAFYLNLVKYEEANKCEEHVLDFNFDKNVFYCPKCGKEASYSPNLGYTFGKDSFSFLNSELGSYDISYAGYNYMNTLLKLDGISLIGNGINRFVTYITTGDSYGGSCFGISAMNSSLVTNISPSTYGGTTVNELSISDANYLILNNDTKLKDSINIMYISQTHLPVATFQWITEKFSNKLKKTVQLAKGLKKGDYPPLACFKISGVGGHTVSIIGILPDDYYKDYYVVTLADSNCKVCPSLFLISKDYKEAYFVMYSEKKNNFVSYNVKEIDYFITSKSYNINYSAPGLTSSNLYNLPFKNSFATYSNVGVSLTNDYENAIESEDCVDFIINSKDELMICDENDDFVKVKGCDVLETSFKKIYTIPIVGTSLVRVSIPNTGSDYSINSNDEYYLHINYNNIISSIYCERGGKFVYSPENSIEFTSSTFGSNYEISYYDYDLIDDSDILGCNFINSDSGIKIVKNEKGINAKIDSMETLKLSVQHDNEELEVENIDLNSNMDINSFDISYEDDSIKIDYNFDNCNHTDSNKDGICDICSTNLTANCTCACHSNAFIKLIYKIIAFILSLFGSSFDCACGMSHR